MWTLRSATLLITAWLPSTATAVRLCTVVGLAGPRNRRAPEPDSSSATASLPPRTTHDCSPPDGAERVPDISAPCTKLSVCQPPLHMLDAPDLHRCSTRVGVTC